ncbi:hypothetical protein [Yersinia intermedia]|uniref:hypothetical protein n=1 Tax=Yersinia intermedia TaxID=631 RepID=UPI001CFEC7FD|nr:hypothetical protein [Yersinia intermedia]MCB5311949.1 hypothetical protein [Yersinia intermedia]MCB5325325.1 hypothetical protein [Yersinia intermedia]
MKPDNDICKCACGYTWKRGFSGHHYCGPQYRATIANLEAERDAAMNTCTLIAEALGITGSVAGDTIARVQQLVGENAALKVPVGYCIMPESLTAENGAKGTLSGEFFTETDITCEECGGDCDEDDPCKHCNDLGVQTVRTAIGWSTIKDIYKMAVSATAIRQAGGTAEVA